MVVSTLIFVVVISSLLYIAFSRDKDEPPGPIPLPVIGNLISITRAGSAPHLALANLAKTYGDVMSLQIGSMRTVIFSSIESAREVLSRPEVQMIRPENTFFRMRNNNQNLGVTFGEGENWIVLRSFVLKRIKDYGFGRSHVMDEKILSEIQTLFTWLRNSMKENNGIVYFEAYFHAFSANTVSTVLAGRSFSYDDATLHQFLKGSTIMCSKATFASTVVTAFPWTLQLCPKLLGVDEVIRGINMMNDFSSSLCENRKKEDSADECLIDAFIEKIDNPENEMDEKIFTKDQLHCAFTDMMQGGSDTTGNYLEFIVLYTAAFPTVQEKVIAELRKIDGPVLLKHKHRLPYTQAMMMETHRWGMIVTTLVPRVADKTFYCRGFKIKQGTTVMANQESMNFDPRIWKNPRTFDPERFLNEKGELDDNIVQNVMPFGVGKRACIAQQMAQQIAFLATSNLLKSFKFSFPPGVKCSLDVQVGLVSTPIPFSALVEERT